MSDRTAAPQREQWSGQLGFLLSAIGSAIGLGNIWRFPGVAYTSGGGAFIVPYVVALLTAGIPILMLDYALGHRFRGSAPAVFRRLGHRFEFIGWLQVGICMVIAAYYIVILAWAASYAGFSFSLAWGSDPTTFFVQDFLGVADPGFNLAIGWSVFWPMLVLWVLVLIVMSARVHKGLEVVNKIALPLLIVLFVAMVIRALFLPGAVDGLNALFTPDWSALTNPAVWVAAYTQIFFSLSVAFGIMMTYASYIKPRANLVPTGLVAAFANSSFEILAGFGVFATLGFMAYSQGVTVGDLEGITGVSLSFMTFPQVISMMPGGQIFGVLFFVSLLLAGFTSMVSIIEVIVAAVREKFSLSRRTAVAAIVGIEALGSILLFATTNGLNALDVVDNFVNNIGILSAAVAECIIVAVLIRKLPELQHHLNQTSTLQLGNWWRLLVGVLNPVALLYVLVATVITLVTTGYGGYPGGFVTAFGWGTVLFLVVAAGFATALRWRTDVDRFTPLPLDPYIARSGKEVSA